MPAPDTMADTTESTAMEQADSLATRFHALVQRLQESAQRGRGAMGAMAELASLEARLAAVSLMQMQGLALGAALLAFSAWGLLLAALVLALAQWTPLGWLGALLVVALINGAAAWLAWRRLRQLTVNLTFESTRQVLFPPEPVPTEPSYDQRPPAAP
jgi:hypothetical protein